jgi:transcriptional regulator
LLVKLTDRNEAAHEHRCHVTDAPDDYVRKEMRHIIGIELCIESLIGRYKLSQNRNAADQEGARAGLAAAPTGRERDLAEAIARTQRERR